MSSKLIVSAGIFFAAHPRALPDAPRYVRHVYQRPASTHRERDSGDIMGTYPPASVVHSE